MLGMAKMLGNTPPMKGEVWLIFQPAEENGLGAQSVLNDPKFDISQIDWVFALHNLPGVEKHQIVVKEGPFTGHVSTAIIKLHGKTAHAAEPEKGYNPSTSITKILQWAEAHTHNVPTDDSFFLITPVYLTMGEMAYGISAGYGEVHLTIRSWSTDLFQEKCGQFTSYIHEVCDANTIRAEIAWEEEFFSNINDGSAVENVIAAAHTNKLDLHIAEQPFKWGEDFGLFTQKSKGAMFGLGAGKSLPALHNPDYDYPDDITETGIYMFLEIAKQHNY